MGGSPNPDNPPQPSTSAERFHLIYSGDTSSSRGMVDRLIEGEEDMIEEEIDHDTICEGSSPKRLKTLGDVGEEEEEGKRTKEESSGERDSFCSEEEEEEEDDDDDVPPSALKEDDMIVLPPRYGLREDTERMRKIRKNFLKRRNLCRKFPLDAFLNSKNERNDLLDQIVRAARILYLDEAELYFVGDHDDGPFSPSNELESLNAILSSLNFASITDTYGDLEEVLKWIHNEVCNKIICYATENSDKYSDNLLYTQFDEASEELLHWAEEKGATSQLRIANVSESGRGAVASEDIGIGDMVLEIPERLIISEDIVQKTDMYKVLENVEQVTSKEMFILWIMKEREEKNSEFATYFETLPQEFRTGLSFGDDARKALEGTGLDRDIWRIEQKLRQRYERLYPIFIEHSNIFPKDRYTFERFIWAYQLLHSHSMKILFSDRKWKTCLVPVAGFFNHSLCPHLLHCDSIDCDTKSLKFIASRPCKRGQQCYMSYGNLQRSDLVTLYGFLPKGDNHHDVISPTYDLDNVRHEVIFPDNGNKWETHMMRGSWFSSGGEDVLPEPLLAHLRAFCGVNYDDIPEIEKRTTVLSFLYSELLDYLDGFGSTDIFEGKKSRWDVELALKYREIDLRIVLSVACFCGTLLGRDQLLIMWNYFDLVSEKLPYLAEINF